MFSFSGADCDVWAWYPNDGGHKNPLQADIDKEIKRLTAQEAKLNEEQQKKRAKTIEELQKGGSIKVELPNEIGSGQVSTTVEAPDDGWTQEQSEAVIKIATSGYTKERNLIQSHISSLQKISAMYAPGAALKLDSVATISVSVHEPKGMVRRLGHKGICGVTRSVRTIAGTMIFIAGVGEYSGHPLEGLMLFDPANARPELMGWSTDMHKGTATSRENGATHFSVSGVNILGNKAYAKLSSLISPFNLYVHYQSEWHPAKNDGGKIREMTPFEAANAGAAWMLQGVEFISEATVSSVNDMVTEISVQFIAADMIPFTSNTGKLNRGPGQAIAEIKSNNEIQMESRSKYYNLLNEGKILGIEPLTRREEAEQAIRMDKKIEQEIAKDSNDAENVLNKTAVVASEDTTGSIQSLGNFTPELKDSFLKGYEAMKRWRFFQEIEGGYLYVKDTFTNMRNSLYEAAWGDESDESHQNPF